MNNLYKDKIKKIESLFLYNKDLKYYLENTLYNLEKCYVNYKENKYSMLDMYFYTGNDVHGGDLIIIGKYNKMDLLFEHLYKFYKKMIHEYNNIHKCYNCPIIYSTKTEYENNKGKYDKYCNKRDLIFSANKIGCINKLYNNTISYKIPIVYFSEFKLSKYEIENV